MPALTKHEFYCCRHGLLCYESEVRVAHIATRHSSCILPARCLSFDLARSQVYLNFGLSEPYSGLYFVCLLRVPLAAHVEAMIGRYHIIHPLTWYKQAATQLSLRGCLTVFLLAQLATCTPSQRQDAPSAVSSLAAPGSASLLLGRKQQMLRLCYDLTVVTFGCYKLCSS